jgi:hypothetical protein
MPGLSASTKMGQLRPPAAPSTGLPHIAQDNSEFSDATDDDDDDNDVDDDDAAAAAADDDDAPHPKRISESVSATSCSESCPAAASGPTRPCRLTAFVGITRQPLIRSAHATDPDPLASR